MEALALGHILYEAVDTFRYNHYCVYLVRDENEILYIGKSTRNVVKRLREHIGRSGAWVSGLGERILMSRPASDSWMAYFFTVEDCIPVIKAVDPYVVNFHPEFAEQSMIELYRPLLNITHNYDRPDRREIYKSLLGDLLDS